MFDAEWKVLCDSILLRLQQSEFFMLCYREEETQLAAVKLIKGLAPSLTPNEVSSLIPSIAALLSNGSVVIREAIYDLFMWIFDEYR